MAEEEIEKLFEETVRKLLKKEQAEGLPEELPNLREHSEAVYEVDPV